MWQVPTETGRVAQREFLTGYHMSNSERFLHPLEYTQTWQGSLRVAGHLFTSAMSFQCSRDIYFCSWVQAQLLKPAVGCSGASSVCLCWITFIQAEMSLNHLVSVRNALVRVGSALGNFCADSRAAGTFGRVQLLLDHVIHKRGRFLLLARDHCT